MQLSLQSAPQSQTPGRPTSVLRDTGMCVCLCDVCVCVLSAERVSDIFTDYFSGLGLGFFFVNL